MAEALLVKNKELADVVLKAMAETLNNQDPSFAIMTDGETELGVSLITGMESHVGIDEPGKVRIHFSKVIGYGYDFTQKSDGKPAKEVYVDAVANTKRVSGDPHFETFMADGVVEDRYGWYMTRV